MLCRFAAVFFPDIFVAGGATSNGPPHAILLAVMLVFALEFALLSKVENSHP